MRKYILLSVLAAALLVACVGKQPAAPTPLAELPADYTLEQAKQDGCITHENGELTQGRARFDKFFKNVTAGQPDAIRLADYYTLDDPARYDPDYYESIKDDPPLLFIEDLTYDGQTFTLKFYEDGKEHSKQYRYLMKYEGPAESARALYQSYVRYVLTNDDTLTWLELFYARYSSYPENFIEHSLIHTDYIYE